MFSPMLYTEGARGRRVIMAVGPAQEGFHMIVQLGHDGHLGRMERVHCDHILATDGAERAYALAYPDSYRPMLSEARSFLGIGVW
jgi:hypothetical protein